VPSQTKVEGIVKVLFGVGAKIETDRDGGLWFDACAGDVEVSVV